MDLKTSFAFYLVSLALYLVVLTAMALADKRVVGTRWLAYSVLVEMLKVALQGMSSSIPRLFSTLVANDLNMIAFFVMYLGLRWFVRRDPPLSRAAPTLLLMVVAGYSAMFLLHVPYAFHVVVATVLWICGATVQMMWRQREERFTVPATITSGLMLVQMALVSYRGWLAFAVYRHGSNWRAPATDPRWDYSMMFILMLGRLPADPVCVVRGSGDVQRSGGDRGNRCPHGLPQPPRSDEACHA